MSESGRQALSDVQKRSEDHRGCPEEVWRPSRMLESGRDALPNVRGWSGDPPRCP